ncbi:hypothetical protein BDY17DRAFT_300292 [Neohortaea acidophila]|uniref:F-box domain-containing protein n=1 Tax=Neohortaea acidophila TaxID=245834 RepID=A0A6A6PPR4_9PEZI|nr:uncharacterized protein BDY17DRAFT_300292 [Neohortaea acidophila]KAF2482100.1 hypothetical protein BDY17DRAFT_300292 [Neohortaea acidophila]
MALASMSSSQPSTPVRGRWVRNAMYQSKLSNNNVDRMFDDFSESVQYPRIDTTQITWAARKAQYSWRRSSKPVLEPTTHKCLLPLLPNEVLIQIMRYLLPLEQSFHVFNYESDQGKRTTMIHRLCTPYNIDQNPLDPVAGNTSPNITALASVCHALSDVYHAVMYGENRFIFELGTSAMWPRPIAKSQSGLHNVESWARAYEASYGTLWPLTQRTSAYVKNVTLLVTKSYQEANKYERILLTAQLNAVQGLLSAAPNLNYLTIDMSTTNGPHEAVSQRLGWKLSGEDEHVLKLREVVNCASSCEDCPGFHSFWELLRDVRCKKEVTLSGHISGELADEMKRAMVLECGGCGD